MRYLTVKSYFNIGSDFPFSGYLAYTQVLNYLRRSMNTQTVRKIYSVRLYLALIFISFAIWRHYRINQNIRYTIATTIRRITTPRNNSQIQFSFLVNGKIFKGSGPDIDKYKIKYPNGRYYLKFPLKSPESNQVLWDRPVPDSVTKVPDEGWEVLPY